MNTMTNPIPREAWQAHPIALIWPEPDAETYAAMKASIQADGQKVSALSFQGMLLDGKTREKICAELGIPLRVEAADARTEEQALKLAIALNTERRQLSMEERAFVAAKIANMKSGTRTDLGPFGPRSASIEDAAKLMKVSVPAVKRAKVIVKEDKSLGQGPKLETIVTTKQQSLTAVADEVRTKNRGTPRTPQGGKMPKVYTFKGLKPHEVDPELAKDPSAFLEKYGHVTLRTKEQLDAREREDELALWRAALRNAAKIADDLKVIPDVKARANWASRNELNRANFKKWRASIHRLSDSLDVTPGFFYDLDDFDKPA